MEKKEPRCRVKRSRDIGGKIKVDYECEGKDNEMKPKTACIDGKSGQKVRCPKEEK